MSTVKKIVRRKKSNVNYLIKFLLAATLSSQLSSSLANNSAFNLPDLGSSANNTISNDLSEKIGKAYIRQARAQQEFIEDPILLSYINTLGNKLVKTLPNNTQRFHFHIVKDAKLNAFAIPGGHIVVNTGLIKRCKTEQQLAATLAHEIAHITQNHAARGIESSRYDSAITIASILLAVATGNAGGAQAAIMAGQGTIAQRHLGYSRNFESEADNEAIKTLFNAGMNPDALTDFLDIMNQEQRFSKTNLPPFLLTHPLTDDRIVQANLRARSYITATDKDNSSPDFLNFKSMIEIEFHGQANSVLKQWEKHHRNTSKHSENELFEYGLALSKTNQYIKAADILSDLSSNNPNKLTYKVAYAELLNKQNQFPSAIAIYNSINKSGETHPLVSLYHANTLILSKQNQQAIYLLERRIENNPNNPLAHILLARAYGELGLLLESYQARSQYHYLRGNFRFAIKQLDNALNQTNNEFIKADLENQKKRLRRELSETEASLNKL